MTQSMTAYASRTGVLGAVSWVWEMRGVNARGFDVRLRLPEGCEALEPALRNAMKAELTRGNVNVSLRITRGDDDASALALDEAQLDRVLQALDHVQERAFSMGVTLGQPTAADVLSHRGVVQHGKSDLDTADLIVALKDDIAPLIVDFVAMRKSEGAALGAVIAGQVDQIEAFLDAAKIAAKARRPELEKSLSQNLARIVSDVTEVDPARIAQELALLTVKQDITEELDRLDAHVAAARGMLEAPVAMGRKLDFLAQEFNREANTLCSKAQNKALTAIGLDLKAVIDQMREQIQNVE